MAYLDSSERPAKKQRTTGEYGTDPLEQPEVDIAASSSPPPPPERFFSSPISSPTLPTQKSYTHSDLSSPLPPPQLPQLQSTSHNARPTPKPAPQIQEHASSAIAFDEEMFESFIGHKIEPDILDIIQRNCQGNLERAVNMYFDGTWKKLKKPSPKLAPPQSSSLPSRKAPITKLEPVAAPQRSRGQPRYIGAFGAEGWATRSGTNLLRHNDTVKIERQRIQVPRATPKGSKTPLGMPVVTARMTAAAARRVDVIVRFTTMSGTEVGRLDKDMANWISTLIDQQIFAFEGKCVYAPERLRTNDTVFLQLKVFLLPTAFQPSASVTERPDDDILLSIREESETAQEKALKLRQVALVRLFQEINMLPTTLDAKDAKEQRKGLLQAAELDEKRAKEPPKDSPKDSPKPNGSRDPASSPPEEPEEGEELEQDQLDALYRKAQSFDFNTPEAEPADTFAMNLRPYQKQALHWMLSKERGESGNREPSLHPLWEEYTYPTRDADDAPLPVVPGKEKFYMNPYSGEMTLDFPAQEQHCLGGILADEMGLGKTIQMLSLIHTHRPHERARPRNGISSSLHMLRNPGIGGVGEVVRAPHTTLVIAPMSLLSQWQSEAEKASQEGTLKSMVYYGAEKNCNLQAVCGEGSAASAPDVIITSYGTVLSEYSQILARKSSPGSGSASDNKCPLQTGLFSLSFFRIILDEAHTIKNRRSKTSKACYALAADHRWVLTGTPIVNRLEDLFSLVRFLGVEPWNNFSFWRTFITVPFESKNFVRALDVVQTVLEPLVMRRTKDMKTPDGQPLVPLPPKHIEIIKVELTDTERKIYNHVFSMARSALDDNMASGTVMKAYASLFAQIIRLRLTCCHPILVRNREILAEEQEAAAASNAAADAATGLADDMDLDVLLQRFAADIHEAGSNGNGNGGAASFGTHVLEQIRSEASNECPICAEEPMVEQTVTGCWHSACKKCLLDYMRHEADNERVPRCVHCREPISLRELFEVIRHDDDGDSPDPATSGKPKISLQRVGSNDSSSKVMALVSHLRALRRQHPHMKSVVFSQFTSFLSLIEPALQRANIHFLRLDGSMSQKARASVLTEFRESRRFTVILMSLRAGGVGLNLTDARRVFMMDPWWSFAVEAQAIDRVHRMGQEGEVRVYRFIVENSVEERMLKVQERKKFIASSLGMMSDEEKKMQRIEDIKDLLSYELK